MELIALTRGLWQQQDTSSSSSRLTSTGPRYTCNSAGSQQHGNLNGHMESNGPPGVERPNRASLHAACSALSALYLLRTRDVLQARQYSRRLRQQLAERRLLAGQGGGLGVGHHTLEGAGHSQDHEPLFDMCDFPHHTPATGTEEQPVSLLSSLLHGKPQAVDTQETANTRVVGSRGEQWEEDGAEQAGEDDDSAGTLPAFPDLALFAAAWLHPRVALRESAQLLLSAYTEPYTPVAMDGPQALPVEAAEGSGAVPDLDRDGRRTPQSASQQPESPMRTLPKGAIVNQAHHVSPGGNMPVGLQQLPNEACQVLASFQEGALTPAWALSHFSAVTVAAVTCLQHSARVPPTLVIASAWGLRCVLLAPLALLHLHGVPLSQLSQQQLSQLHSAAAALACAEGGALPPPAAMASALLAEALKGNSPALWKEGLEPWAGFVARWVVYVV